MPPLSINGYCMNKASDSDESFHCCGRPGDLALDPPTPKREPTRPRKEIFVPENSDFYCYESGMARQKQEESKRLSALESSGSSSRASMPPIVGRIQSSDSDKTLAEEPLLVIHTGVSPVASSSRRTRRLESSPTKRNKQAVFK
ncbi:hypothetical protein VP01_2600g1 [Puccinia sorghi]|uniref:Uncharacterized protein n=1 Tax=Puccinia sorghi TaxID=27349 RepID=A0A0L6V4N1_9BASI|nr:hypothetical protein VP01_2600g1 [Puccinia sorghi]